MTRNCQIDKVMKNKYEACGERCGAVSLNTLNFAPASLLQMGRQPVVVSRAAASRVPMEILCVPYVARGSGFGGSWPTSFIVKVKLRMRQELLSHPRQPVFLRNAQIVRYRVTRRADAFIDRCIELTRKKDDPGLAPKQHLFICRAGSAAVTRGSEIEYCSARPMRRANTFLSQHVTQLVMATLLEKGCI